MHELNEMKSLFDTFVEQADDFISKEKERGKIREAVTKILEEDEKARGNTPYLIYRVYKQMGWPTDLEQIAKNPINRFESISRARRKAQELNPMLMPEEKITQRRQELEEEYRTEMRGL